jgi:uncharacterized protein (TIGR04255 family)
MPVARPIAETNAIEATAFVLVFSREFEVKEVEALLSLEHSLKTILPSFTKTSSLTLNVVDNAPAEQTQQLSGVLLQSFQVNGKPDWALRASDNMIVVNCLKYDNWENVWPKACQLMLRAAQCVDSDTNSIAHAAFQVIDKFVYDEKPTPYFIKDVFNQESEFLTPQIKNAGELWHIFQGWFEGGATRDTKVDEVLHILKLASSMNNEKLVAQIDHTLQKNFKNKIVNVKELLGLKTPEYGSIFANQLFKDLHDKNVLILRNVLAMEQQIAIGLKQ